ncbi:MAG: Fic family protein [Methyloprofundus sp.]|nr:Fic family protein [Methyloprofundus sp.]
MADQLPFLLGRLSGSLADETAQALGDLLKVTNTYYSNLIEGQFTEPLTLNPNTPKRQRKELSELAVIHMMAQNALERSLRQHRDLPWSALFSPNFLQRVHRRLFETADPALLLLADGSRLNPGSLRSDEQRDVMVGTHKAPSWESVVALLERMKFVYGDYEDPRKRVLAAFAYHHRLSWVHPFADGNGRLLRMITHLQLYKLGLASPLWSLSRGLARQQTQYYAALAAADRRRLGDTDGRGQLSQQGLFDFLRFMLRVSLDQINYMIACLDTPLLADRVERAFATNEKLIRAGVRVESAKAITILLKFGRVKRGDFKIYTGLNDRYATGQLTKLIELGLVGSKTPKARDLTAKLPVWFAQLIFPDLHRRFL